MKILLVVLLSGALLIATLVWLAASGFKRPLQDVPVAKRAWGRVALVVRQMNHFEMGKPGRTEYFLVAAAAEIVARCPEAASSEPSFAVSKEGGVLRVELKPTLTGGRCGRHGFEGDSLPGDPRRAEIDLPDLEKAPVRVVFSSEGRTAELALHADRDKIYFETTPESANFLAPRAAALKRLPRTLYLALGLDRHSLNLWGGNIKVVPAEGDPERGDAVGELVQYCRAPAPFEYASGTAVYDGKDVAYTQGVSDEPLDAVYRELADEERADGREPKFTLYALGLDGSRAERP